MKTALAFVCTLLIAWTQFGPARPASASEAPAACCDCPRGCCAAETPSPESPPVSAAPVPHAPEFRATLAPAVLAWALPPPAAREFSAAAYSPVRAADAPLFARNCARLL